MELELVNLTPHPICLIDEKGEEFKLLSSDLELRSTAQEHDEYKKENGFSIRHVAKRCLTKPLIIHCQTKEVCFENVEEYFKNLDHNVKCIISYLAFQAIEAFHPELKKRFLCPDTSKNAVRDVNGKIVGVKCLVEYE